MVTGGDAAIVSTFGSLFPTQGTKALLMTTEPDAGPDPGDADESFLRIENFTSDLVLENKLESD